MENEEIIIETKDTFVENHPTAFVTIVSVAGIAVSVAFTVGAYYLIGKALAKGFGKEVSTK